MFKCLEFDVLGTLINLGGASRDDLAAYAAHIKPWRTKSDEPQPWAPLTLPESWADLPPFPDSADAMARLRALGFRCVTLSNAPVALQEKMLANAGIVVDWIVPIEFSGAYKPDVGRRRPYEYGCGSVGAAPHECAMITGNRTFGDLEAAAEIGMTPILIRDPQSKFRDLAALADHFEANTDHGSIS